MNNKKEIIVLIIIIISIILITIGGMTFAYFAANKTVSNLNLDVSTAESMYSFETEVSGNINLGISFNDMSGAKISTGAVKSALANINATITNAEDGIMTKCTYDILWVWDSEDRYIEPDVPLPYTHEETKKKYNYEFSTKVDTDSEIDLSKLEKIEDGRKLILKKGLSVFLIEKESKTITHQITAKIYNLPVDQENLFNKQFKAHIEIDNVNCNMEKLPSVFEDCPKETDLVSCIRSLDSNEKTEFADGEGILYHHNTELENSAEDDGYRYAGNQPNNYICFGAGSEDYNSGKTDECPLTNKYRIIGFIPVIKSDGITDKLIKIIKSEFITADELGLASQGAVGYNTNVKYQKVEANAKMLPGFHWNDKEDNTWEGSSLFSILNDEAGYLDFLYGDNKEKWENKIEEVKWNVEGGDPSNLGDAVAINAYIQEVKNENFVTAKIGAIYVYDYAYAVPKSFWTVKLGRYENSFNWINNWLFNGVREWTISRVSSTITNSFCIGFSGHIGSGQSIVNIHPHGVRPTFYLNSSVKITIDDTATGSKIHPYRVS